MSVPHTHINTFTHTHVIVTYLVDVMIAAREPLAQDSATLTIGQLLKPAHQQPPVLGIGS